ncbi:hypothetical protein ID866_5452 [Astraeus odoratus]|nr:hypothetical protein ID866_5452 [Astraeus odoratus]
MTSAKVLLWPESAVVFNSQKERELAFERVRAHSNGAYVGVAFEQYAEGHEEPWAGSRTKNGLAIIHRSQQPGEEVIQYYKQQLVPRESSSTEAAIALTPGVVTESFSKIPSIDPPKIHRLELKHPRHIPAPEWSSPPNFTRSIPLTTSICLDLASPTAFRDLASRPALILAPARTWETTVSLAMWEQAKTRAAELDSMVLWCDGGFTGVSGVGGQGIHEIMQVGGGSWTRTIGVPWPFNERKTVYATGGEWFVLIFLAAVMGGDFAVSYLVHNVGRGGWAVMTGGRLLLNRIPVFQRMIAARRGDGDDLVGAEGNNERQRLLD